MTHVIENDDYRQVRKQLTEDLIVRQMAKEIEGSDLATMQHDDGTPRYNFMSSANIEYDHRGGTISNRHLGAVAEALLMVLKGKAK